MTRRFRSYLQVTQGKIIIWGGFMIPYLLVMIWFSPLLPTALRTFVRRAVFQATAQFAPLADVSAKHYTLLDENQREVDLGELTIGYILVTYLWACILVESFGTIHHNGKKGIFQNQSIHPGSAAARLRRIRKTARRHDKSRSTRKSQ